MPPAVAAAASAAMTTRLALGDTVSVAVGAFGEEYARSRGASPWRSEHVRDEGKVIGREGNKWKVEFSDAVHLFDRKALWFVCRQEAGDTQTVGRRRAFAREAEDSEDEQHDGEAEADSSDEDTGPGAPEHEGGRAQIETTAEGEWRRDDHYGVDERARHGFTSQNGPQINGLSDWESASLFTFAKHFLPMNFINELARSMEEAGAAHFSKGKKAYANWKVTANDVLQWIGVWMYMLSPHRCAPASVARESLSWRR
ncbi:hypothetical protein AB1Y20_001673 [Prymnesium parvum]|uniref:PiggyBac transposable element-derived protein domain-containing protein n=1 Tax=Prymnesium parvum TaxID=97485 RepID=A0AB34K8V1_PRYPA